MGEPFVFCLFGFNAALPSAKLHGLAHDLERVERVDRAVAVDVALCEIEIVLADELHGITHDEQSVQGVYESVGIDVAVNDVIDAGIDDVVYICRVVAAVDGGILFIRPPEDVAPARVRGEGIGRPGVASGAGRILVAVDEEAEEIVVALGTAPVTEGERFARLHLQFQSEVALRAALAPVCGSRIILGGGPYVLVTVVEREEVVRAVDGRFKGVVVIEALDVRTVRAGGTGCVLFEYERELVIAGGGNGEIIIHKAVRSPRGKDRPAVALEYERIAGCGVDLILEGHYHALLERKAGGHNGLGIVDARVAAHCGVLRTADDPGILSGGSEGRGAAGDVRSGGERSVDLDIAEPDLVGARGAGGVLSELKAQRYAAGARDNGGSRLPILLTARLKNGHAVGFYAEVFCALLAADLVIEGDGLLGADVELGLHCRG